MQNIYSNKSDDFEFEKYICFEKPILWLNEANYLFYSAEVLYEFENLKYKDFFDKTETKSEIENIFSENLTKRAFFNYRVQRMLWAYGFENVLKGIIILKKKKSDPSLKQVPLKEIKSHDLIDLAKKSDLAISNDDEFYLGILTKCALWAGRYPLPIKDNQMYQTRAPMKSRQALFDRQEKMWRKYIEGKIPRMESERDIMFSGLGTIEYKYYSNFKEKTINLLKELDQ